MSPSPRCGSPTRSRDPPMSEESQLRLEKKPCARPDQRTPALSGDRGVMVAHSGTCFPTVGAPPRALKPLEVAPDGRHAACDDETVRQRGREAAMSVIRKRALRAAAAVLALGALTGALDTGCDGGLDEPGDGGSGGPDGKADAAEAGGSGCTRNASCPTGNFCDLPADGGGAGVSCPARGCAPACPNGVATDANGCATCQCAPSPDGGGSGSTCTTNADCANGSICGYPVADGCAAKGSCFPGPGAVCELYAPGCACDGSEISVACTGLPSGYA